ncbi:mRNA surveillance protein pelota [Candidatus Micrarchaeota archaeon]|nr:mRNA surveillance protein pelota [Candidatus Micrarchaeota archaeon]
MKVHFFDPKTGEMRLQIDTLDDMWHLEKIILPNDLVESRTFRTYKVGTKEEKKPVIIRIKVENAEFAKNANRLRVLGVIVWGEPEEFVQMGRYHTIEVPVGEQIRIVKSWKKYELERLREAEKESKRARIRIIVLDDEKALNAELRAYGIAYGAEFYSSGSKNDDNYDKTMNKYFDTILNEIDRHGEKYIVAGPGFTRDNLKKYIEKKKPELLKRIVFEIVSDAERSGVNELFTRGVIEKIAGEERANLEMKLMEEFMSLLYRETGLVAYGLKEVARAMEKSAVDRLLIVDETLRLDQDAQALVDLAEKSGTKIFILSLEGDAGAKLKGFGKIAAFLRYKLD